jgi:hypothetical protein
MKSAFFLFFLAAVAAGCRTPRETGDPAGDVAAEEVRGNDGTSAETNTVKGKVKLEEGCGVIIQVTYGDVRKRYYPLNLEDRFKVDGLTLKFSFTAAPDGSGAPACEAVIPVYVSEVAAYR